MHSKEKGVVHDTSVVKVRITRHNYRSNAVSIDLSRNLGADCSPLDEVRVQALVEELREVGKCPLRYLKKPCRR